MNPNIKIQKKVDHWGEMTAWIKSSVWGSSSVTVSRVAESVDADAKLGKAKISWFSSSEEAGGQHMQDFMDMLGTAQAIANDMNAGIFKADPAPTAPVIEWADIKGKAHHYVTAKLRTTGEYVAVKLVADDRFTVTAIGGNVLGTKTTAELFNFCL